MIEGRRNGTNVFDEIPVRGGHDKKGSFEPEARVEEEEEEDKLLVVKEERKEREEAVIRFRRKTESKQDSVLDTQGQRVGLDG
ncbi:hypothetical protein ACLOJK_001229 [Asimina triloba]